MRTPENHEHAAWVATGDAALIVDALAAYALRSDIPTFRVEQAGDLMVQFMRMAQSGGHTKE